MPKSIPSLRRLLPLGLAALLALLVGTVPSHAGTVYVPLTVQTTVDGIDLETQVWLTNSTGQFAKAEVVFIPLGSDGTDRKGVKPQEVPVWAGTTVRYDPLPNGPGIGLLEITLPDGVYATARVVGDHPLFGHALGTEVPVVTSANLIPDGGTAQVQGWQREAEGVVTDFGLVNLSHQANSCQVSVFNGGGAQVKNSVLLPIQPLSMVHFTDALGVLGENDNPNARAEVTCDGDFYPFSLLSDFRTGETLFLTPSGSGSSALLPPGSAPKTPQCAPGAECFVKAGLFHRPTPSNPVARVSAPIPGGTYSKLRARVTVVHGGWAPGRENKTHNIIWLVKDARNFNMFGYFNVKGPRANSIFNRHGFNQVQGDKARMDGKVVLEPGKRYHFDYVFDTAARSIVLTVTDAAGNVLSALHGRPNINSIQLTHGGEVTADFGFRDGININEPPTYGWEYRDYVLELFK